jgi:hypothetical protein
MNNQETFEQMKADIQNPEPLDPMLEECLEDTSFLGIVLKHPLVFSVPYAPFMNRELNKQLDSKIKSLEKAIMDEDWDTVILLHERPYRLEAFLDIMDEISDQAYWETLAWMWRDSENIREFPTIWTSLLMSDRAHREHLMTDAERETLSAMPETFTVWQGHTEGRDDGWSWTFDKKVAEWFARRFARLEDDQPLVTEALVQRDDVVALFLERGESEVIVDPDKHLTFVRATMLGDE